MMIYEVTYNKNGYKISTRCTAEWLKSLMADPAITNLTWRAEI